jgi:hypothetical protein
MVKFFRKVSSILAINTAMSNMVSKNLMVFYAYVFDRHMNYIHVSSEPVEVLNNLKHIINLYYS